MAESEKKTIYESGYENSKKDKRQKKAANKKIIEMRQSLLNKLHVFLPKNLMLLPNRLENLLN